MNKVMALLLKILIYQYEKKIKILLNVLEHQYHKPYHLEIDDDQDDIFLMLLMLVHLRVN